MSDNKDRVYAPGMNWKQPNESAPEFIKAKVGIKVFEEDGKEGEFIKFLKDNAKKDGWVNFEMKLSQDGRYYFELDTWEPKPQVEEDAPF
jgi:hypothetical protein